MFAEIVQYNQTTESYSPYLMQHGYLGGGYFCLNENEIGYYSWSAAKSTNRHCIGTYSARSNRNQDGILAWDSIRPHLSYNEDGSSTDLITKYRNLSDEQLDSMIDSLQKEKDNRKIFNK